MQLFEVNLFHAPSNKKPAKFNNNAQPGHAWDGTLLREFFEGPCKP